MRGTLRSAALVEAWFDMLPPDQVPLTRALQRAVLDAAPQLGQAVKWGNLVFTLGGAHLLAIMTHKTHANLQVFHGAQLASRFPQLEGSGKGLRHLKCRYGDEVDADVVRALVLASVQAQQQHPLSRGRTP